jgi:hypothetical protein
VMARWPVGDMAGQYMARLASAWNMLVEFGYNLAMHCARPDRCPQPFHYHHQHDAISRVASGSTVVLTDCRRLLFTPLGTPCHYYHISSPAGPARPPPRPSWTPGRRPNQMSDTEYGGRVIDRHQSPAYRQCKSVVYGRSAADNVGLYRVWRTLLIYRDGVALYGGDSVLGRASRGASPQHPPVCCGSEREQRQSADRPMASRPLAQPGNRADCGRDVVRFSATER